jgi:hypothetical protein
MGWRRRQAWGHHDMQRRMSARWSFSSHLPDLDTVSLFPGFNHVQLDNIRIYEAK